jgi:hypothetical protein
MKEKELEALGFERTDVTAEESGDKPFFYYTLDFGLSKGISLISCDDEQAKEDGWYVEIFEDNSIRFNDYQDVSDFIRIVKKGIAQG